VSESVCVISAAFCTSILRTTSEIIQYTRTGRNLYLKHSIVSFVGLKRALTETEVISVA
jgi:hypothetical protein